MYWLQMMPRLIKKRVEVFQDRAACVRGSFSALRGNEKLQLAGRPFVRSLV